jgi:hypothetical protein
MSALAAEARTLFMPPWSKMGKIKQIRSETYVAVMGSIPNPNITGLLTNGQGQNKRINQQCSITTKYNNPKRHVDGIC